MDHDATDNWMDELLRVLVVEKRTEVVYKLRNLFIRGRGVHRLMCDAILHDNIVITPEASCILGVSHRVIRHETMYL